MDTWFESEYRCWDKRGEHWERLKPEDVDDVNPENREKRLKRCIFHITVGADRTICRAFVRSEEEWRAAVNRAGREPGEGWLVRPSDSDGTAHLLSEPDADDIITF